MAFSDCQQHHPQDSTIDSLIFHQSQKISTATSDTESTNAHFSVNEYKSNLGINWAFEIEKL